jgi:16S rRNA (guanine1207-N2)-methyltransferase
MTEHYFTEKPKSKPRFGIIRTYFRDRLFEFVTASGVFSKTKIDLGTRLLIESMIIPEKGYVLDLGCGYGPVGIVAATLYPKLHIIMTDLNERALWLAKENAKYNKTENVEVRKGFLYEPVKDLKFETILSNPPTTAGMNGLLQMVVRSKISGKRLTTKIEETFGNIKIHARKSGYRVLTAKN